MGLLHKKQLNKAEKFVLCAVFAAMLVTSSKPQVTHASDISLPTIDSQAAPQPADEPPLEVAPITIKSTLTVVSTAYSSTPDQTDASPFTTSNGKQVYDGLVAANWLPYGTKIRIPDLYGDKIFTVNDRMNARYKTGRMDVWMPTRQAAKIYGIRHIRIQIVETND